MANQKLSDESLDIIFRNARTYSTWQSRPVEDSLLKQLHELFILGPTSANNLPARIVYVKSKEAKEKLKPCMDEGNVDKTMKAPVTAIIGMDVHFYEKLPKTFPHTDAKSWFDHLPENALTEIARQNSSLQGGYFIIAARALGLDCGPMNGFNNDKVDELFFTGQPNVKSNFLCNLGYGDPIGLHPRSPRLGFDEISKIM